MTTYCLLNCLYTTYSTHSTPPKRPRRPSPFFDPGITRACDAGGGTGPTARAGGGQRGWGSGSHRCRSIAGPTVVEKDEVDKIHDVRVRVCEFVSK